MNLYLSMTSDPHVGLPTTDNWTHLVFVNCFMGRWLVKKHRGTV